MLHIVTPSLPLRVHDAADTGPCAFVVGCPRSGTTLLQSLLATGPAFHSLPETSFFQLLLRSEEHRMQRDPALGPFKRIAKSVSDGRRRVLARVGTTSRRRALLAWTALHGLVDQRFATPLPQDMPEGLCENTRRFGLLMTSERIRFGKHAWLEKTPDHLFYLRQITRYLPQARVIHILRDGEEVVASLHDAARKYREWSSFLDVDRGVDRWNRAVRESLRWQGHPQHVLVRYESLLEDPERHIRQLLGLLQVADGDTGSWRNHAQAARRLVSPGQPWKQANFSPLQDRRKFRQLFDAGQRSRIRAALLPLDWPALSQSPGVVA